MVEKWIGAIPPGDGEDPNHFFRQSSVVVTLHSRVATLQMAVRPHDAAAADASTASAAAAAGAEAVLYRLADIVLGIPVHAQAVDARLDAQLGQSSVVGDELGGSV